MFAILTGLVSILAPIWMGCGLRTAFCSTFCSSLRNGLSLWTSQLRSSVRLVRNSPCDSGCNSEGFTLLTALSFSPGKQSDFHFSFNFSPSKAIIIRCFTSESSDTSVSPLKAIKTFLPSVTVSLEMIPEITGKGNLTVFSCSGSTSETDWSMAHSEHLYLFHTFSFSTVVMQVSANNTTDD